MEDYDDHIWSEISNSEFKLYMLSSSLIVEKAFINAIFISHQMQIFGFQISNNVVNREVAVN